jgi:hypothetical protein
MNPIVQDDYIKYLANVSGGKSPVSWNSSPVQKKPILNLFAATLVGAVQSVSLVGCSVLLFPFTNSNTFESIIGPNICVPCASNTAKLHDLALKFNFIDNNISNKVWEKISLFAAKEAFATLFAEKCVIDASEGQKSMIACRATNYLSAVYDTLASYPVIIGSAALVLAVGMAIWNNESYKESEIEAETAFIHNLEDKFAAIACRMDARETSAEMKDYSRKILANQVQINSEIHNLGLRWKQCENITKPVIAKATQISHKP